LACLAKASPVSFRLIIPTSSIEYTLRGVNSDFSAFENLLLSQDTLFWRLSTNNRVDNINQINVGGPNLSSSEMSWTEKDSGKEKEDRLQGFLGRVFSQYFNMTRISRARGWGQYYVVLYTKGSVITTTVI
jgi:hypothetical protein